jgi:hypothetical protein
MSLLLSAGLALAGRSLLAQTSSSSSAPDQPPQSRALRLQKLLNPDQAERQATVNQPGSGEVAPAPTVPTVTAPPTAPLTLPPAPPIPATAAPALPTQTNLAAKPLVPIGPKLPPAAVKSVQIVHDKDGSAIEILTSRPVPPALQTLPYPPRLVIDLPNANDAVKDKQIAAVEGAEFTGVRVDQFQVAPPVTRVVVDLRAANQYTWDAAGNRLMIRLKPADPPKPQPSEGAQPATISTFGSATKPAVVPVTTHPADSMVLAGSRIGSGSSVTASNETAVLHIARGGEVHVCPGSTVSVSASRSGGELMLGMSSGALETHYHLSASSDAILTPDFRILLAGPGDFDFAVSANTRGDTCVRALLGNNASAIVTELMGDRSYQVKPTEQVVFHEGRIDRLSNEVPADCGCPGTPQPVMQASVSPTTTVSDTALPSNIHLPSSSAQAFRASLDPMLPPLPSSTRPAMTSPSGSQVNLASMSPETAPLPPSKPNDIHVQIVAPFAFRGTDPAPAPVTKAQNLPARPATQTAKLDPPALPPPSVPPPKPPDTGTEPKPKHHGFFGHVKGLFASIFK